MEGSSLHSPTRVALPSSRSGARAWQGLYPAQLRCSHLQDEGVKVACCEDGDGVVAAAAILAEVGHHREGRVAVPSLGRRVKEGQVLPGKIGLCKEQATVSHSWMGWGGVPGTCQFSSTYPGSRLLHDSARYLRIQRSGLA